MKRIIITVLVAIVGISAMAQGNGLFRAGVGVNLDRAVLTDDRDLSSELNVGPSLFIEYERSLNPWLSVTGGVSFSNNHMNKKILASAEDNVTLKVQNSCSHLSLDINGLVRPLYMIPVLNRIEVGGGLTADYTQEREHQFGTAPFSLQGPDVVYVSPAKFYLNKRDKVRFGVIAKGRLHLLETMKLDVSVDYAYRLLRYRETFGAITHNWFYYHTIALSLGVKF